MSTHYPTFGRTSGLGSVFKSFTKSLKSTSSTGTSNVPISVNPKVVGGGADQQLLFSQLSNGPTLQVRASAALKMSESLEKYAISSIPEIWYAARDMCEPKSGTVNPTIRRSAVQLLLRCIEQDHTMSTSVRLVYFQDIVRYCSNQETKLDPDFDLFLRALIQLTNNGRDIYELTIYHSEENLNTFISKNLATIGTLYERTVVTSSSASLSAIISASSTSNDMVAPSILSSSLLTPSSTITSGGNSTSQAEGTHPFLVIMKSLSDLVQFSKNCLKFNFNIIDEASLTLIISKILSVGIISCLKEVSMFGGGSENASSSAGSGFGSGNNMLPKTLTEECVDLVHAVIMYGHIPTNCFANAIEFLCCGYSLCPETTWESVCNLSNDVSQYLVLTAMCDIVSSDELSKEKALYSRPVQASIGAILLLERIHIFYSSEGKGSIEYIYATILKAAQTNLSYNVPVLVTTYLKSLNERFSVDNIQSFEKLFPFSLWYSTNLSMYDIMKSITLNTEEDAELWTQLCSLLQVLYEQYHVLHTPKDKLVDFFMHYHHRLSEPSIEFVLNYYLDERLCVCHANPQWRENSFKLLNYFYYNEASSSNVRIKTLKVISEAFELSVDSIDSEILVDIFRKSITLKSLDRDVVKYLQGILIKEVLSRTSLSTYSELLEIYKAAATNNTEENAQTKEFMEIMCEAFCTIFVITSTNDPAKAKATYEFLVSICEQSIKSKKVMILLIISRCLVRLRCTNEGYFYFNAPADMAGLATAVGRNINEATYIKYDHVWVYPESLDYLPEEYFNMPCRRLVLYLTGQQQLQHHMNEPTYIMDIGKWFDIVLDILQNFVGWEIFTFMWAHFCPQLSNMKLFSRNQSQILRLRTIVCDQLTLNFPAQIVIPTRTTKSDLQIMFVRTLSALMGYHTPFSKQDEDSIINALIFGLGSWEKTAIPCIHILTVCCYEIPLSIKKFLSLILTQLQTRISSQLAASPTLEFLLSLINLETLTSNFTLDEYRRVFAIAFKYIQHSNERKGNLTDDNVNIQMHGVDATVDQTPSTSTQASTIISQYVLTLSYQVISNWYLRLNLNDRKQLSSFLIKNVLASNSESSNDQQTVAYIDLITRFTYSDLNLEFGLPNKKLGMGGSRPTSALNNGMSASHNNMYSSNNTSSNNFCTNHSWIIGETILSITTDGSTGESEVFVRRPTGTSTIRLNLSNSEFFDSVAIDRPLVSPNHILLQLFNNLDINNKTKPIPLIEDPVTMRAISAFDRIPTIEFHKIGLVYIGPNQAEEKEILSNQVGSVAYEDFLENIGSIIRLKNCKEVYAGGLDTESNTDGEYAIFWKNKIQQLIFHTTTMMPNNENDKRFELKKRHIGNNYVNIFFDESGLPFNFNVIKSQFNFLNIVIQPHSLSSSNFPVSSSGYNRTQPGGSDSASNSGNYFKVQTIRRAGVPAIFATCHFKIVSQEQLPSFIRNLSFLANQFASVWHAPGEYVSNWALRLNQIRTLKEKTIKNHEALREEQEKQQLQQQQQARSSSSGGNSAASSKNKVVGTNTAQSFLEQLRDIHPSSTNIASVDSAKYEYVASGESELFEAFEFNSYT